MINPLSRESVPQRASSVEVGEEGERNREREKVLGLSKPGGWIVAGGGSGVRTGDGGFIHRTTWVDRNPSGSGARRAFVRRGSMLRYEVLCSVLRRSTPAAHDGPAKWPLDDDDPCSREGT